MQIRTATLSDAPAIAEIHAESWRSTYQRALNARYLAEVVPRERAEVWRGRLTAPKPNQHVVVAEQQGALVGFACVFAAENPRWGSYLDNLHVRGAWQGRGIGKALLQEVARWCSLRAAEGGLCLLVNQDNVAAQGFYERLGARNAEASAWNAPDGSVVPTYWFVWDDLAPLLGGA